MMMGGGIFEGDSVLVSGPAGTGKTAIATHCLAEVLRRGEAGTAAIFEERPQAYVALASSFALDLETLLSGRASLRIVNERLLIEHLIEAAPIAIDEELE